MKGNYIIKGGRLGSERLKKILKVTWNTTNKYVLQAGLKENMTVLDIACGNGLISAKMKEIVGNTGNVFAFDFDHELIELAKILNKNFDINFFEFDLSKNDLDFENKFDFIFARYFFSHISNPKEVILKIKKMLKKGGKFYLEDIDYSGHFCYPANKAFDKYVELYTKLSNKKKGNSYMGGQLYELSDYAGFKNIEIFSSNMSYNKGIGKEIAIITYEAIKDALIKEKLITGEESEKLIFDLNNFTKQKNSIVSLPRLFYCFGEK